MQALKYIALNPRKIAILRKSELMDSLRGSLTSKYKH